MRTSLQRKLGTAAAVLLLAVCPVAGDDGWTDVAEFSYVMTDGNAETTSLGFSNTLARAWDRSGITIRAGGIRAESTTVLRSAVDDGVGNITVSESSSTALTAENYYLNGRYDRKITDRFFWFGGTGWDRNRFAGVQNRYVVEGGVGNIWYDTDSMKFRTDYAATFTDQEDVIGTSDSFAGARLSWAYLNKLAENATYENVLVLDGNLDETSDYRGDMLNSLAVSMSEKLALKLGLRLLYDNMPALTRLGVVDLGGVPTGDTVLVELDDLDTIFTVSLVVNWK